MRKFIKMAGVLLLLIPLVLTGCNTPKQATVEAPTIAPNLTLTAYFIKNSTISLPATVTPTGPAGQMEFGVQVTGSVNIYGTPGGLNQGVAESTAGVVNAPEGIVGTPITDVGTPMISDGGGNVVGSGGVMSTQGWSSGPDGVQGPTMEVDLQGTLPILGTVGAIIDTDGTPAPPPGSSGEKGGVAGTATRTATRVVAGAPMSRAGANIEAAYMPQAPVIDGNIGEWALTTYSAAKVVHTANNWQGQDGLQFFYQIGWDENYLYLALQANDVYYQQNATGAEIFKGDGIEILLDANLHEDFHAGSLTADDYQLGISAGNGNPGNQMEAYLWYPSHQSGAQASVLLAGVNTGGGYIIEAAIPWHLFGVSARDNLEVGFSLSINNNDANGKQLQSIVSNSPNRILIDPTTWGSLKLVR